MTSDSKDTDTSSQLEKKSDNQQEQKSANPKVHGWWSSEMAMRCDSVVGMIWRAGPPISVAVPSFDWWKRICDGKTIPVTCITSDGSTVCPYGSRVLDVIYLGELDGDSWRSGCKSQLGDANAMIKRLYETAPVVGASATFEQTSVATASA